MEKAPPEPTADQADRRTEVEPYAGPAGGWGSVKSLVRSALHHHLRIDGVEQLLRQNKPDGFACVSCAWAKPAKPHPFEFCENGAKATAFELTTRRADARFFGAHTLSELEHWSDHDLEATGRLTEPLRWSRTSDKYLPVDWNDAFDEIGAELRAIAPRSAVFYTSGRASLEASYMYQLFARLYGHNNLPDSSNMCHESSSVALAESLGVPVGTVWLDDFEQTDCIFYLGQNVGTSSPRFLHDLQRAARRGVPIVVFNPLRERGLERFVNPQAPSEMLSGNATRIASHYYQLVNGGDIAALFGIAKALLDTDRQALADGKSRAVAVSFIDEHTHGFDAFAQAARAHSWDALERNSGLTRQQMREAADVYAKSQRAIWVYGMGLTQHRAGVDNVSMVCNLALMRGNVGKPGAGICAVRGHSNVQGQRTVGITEKPELAPLDRLAQQYKFEPPRDKGYDTIETCEAIQASRLRAFIGLGGNFLRAIPDSPAVEAAWRKLRLTVHVATKPNRSHVIHGEVAFLLPCLGRIELDQQASGEQAVSVEDSLAHIHGSRGRATPASAKLRSEPAIIAGLAKASLPPNPTIDWDAWVSNYARVRQAITATYPDIFHDYEQAMWQPGGLARPLAARSRRWNTASGKANFIVPRELFAGVSADMLQDPSVLQLATLRSNDQFNTTIYSYQDRFRGIDGTRMVVLMNEQDIAARGLRDGALVRIECALDGDGIKRALDGFRVIRYNLPRGCCAAYYPECNPLIPLSHHADRSKVPGYKAVPVRVRLITPS